MTEGKKKTLPIVFISYSHKDEDEKDALITHLEVLNSQSDDSRFGVVVWSDDRIGGGGNWEQEIENAMEQASVAIMLISANFLASKFIRNKEIPKLLDRREQDGLVVIPVIAHDCAWERVGWLGALNVRPKNGESVWRDKGMFANTALAGIANEVADLLGKNVLGSNSKIRPSLELPFTNRNDELENVISTTAPPYHIFDAPAGYGKTTLLQRIKTRFEEKKWLTALINVNGQQKKKEIIYQLAKELKLDDSQLVDGDLTQKFGGLLFDEWRFNLVGGNKKKGVVFLFDLEGKSSDIFEYIVNSLIPEIKEILNDSEFFTQTHNAFRVIFTGRYLSRYQVVSKAKIDFKIAKLTPFNLKFIQATISQHNWFKEIKEATLNKFAADLVFVTGGHPGCIAKIVELRARKGGAISKFVETNSDDIWKDIVKPFVDEIRVGIPLNLRGKLDALSVLRRFDTALLMSMIQEYWESDTSTDSTVTDSQKEKLRKDVSLELEEELLKTQLIDRNHSERILEDGITRRLLAIYLRQESVTKNTLLFQTRCRKAKDFCKERIETDASLQGPEKWLTEYLFQDLQQHAPFIFKKSYRKGQRDKFFTDTLPSALKMFVDVRGKDKWRDDKLALIDWIDKDWEFCYTLNYYLRESSFSEYPCKKLLNTIKKFK